MDWVAIFELIYRIEREFNGNEGSIGAQVGRPGDSGDVDPGTYQLLAFDLGRISKGIACE